MFIETFTLRKALGAYERQKHRGNMCSDLGHHSCSVACLPQHAPCKCADDSRTALRVQPIRHEYIHVGTPCKSTSASNLQRANAPQVRRWTLRAGRASRLGAAVSHAAERPRSPDFAGGLRVDSSVARSLSR